MQEVVTKKTEIIKINGKRFLADGENVREFTKEDEETLLNKLTSYLIYLGLKKIIKPLFLQQDEKGNQYFEVFSQDEPELNNKRFYIKNVHIVPDPSLVGQDVVEGADYFIYYDGSEVWSFCTTTDGCNSFKNITNDLIDGKIIR